LGYEKIKLPEVNDFLRLATMERSGF